MKKMVKGGALLLAAVLLLEGAWVPAEADVLRETAAADAARTTVVATPQGGTQTTVEGSDGSVTTLLCEGGATRIAVSLPEESASPFDLPVEAGEWAGMPFRLSLECAGGGEAALRLPFADAGAVTLHIYAADGGMRTLSVQPAGGMLTFTLADGETAVVKAA